MSTNALITDATVLKIVNGLYRDEKNLSGFIQRLRPRICPFDALLPLVPSGTWNVFAAIQHNSKHPVPDGFTGTNMNGVSSERSDTTIPINKQRNNANNDLGPH